MRLLTALLIGSCLTATGALAQSTGSYVMSDASLPKSSQQSEGNLPPGHGWLEIIKRPTPEAFAAGFTKDVVLDASVLPRSITGATALAPPGSPHIATTAGGATVLRILASLGLMQSYNEPSGIRFSVTGRAERADSRTA